MGLVQLLLERTHSVAHFQLTKEHDYLQAHLHSIDLAPDDVTYAGPPKWTEITCIGDCPPLDMIEPCRCQYPHDPSIVCSNITTMDTINDLFNKTGVLRFKYFTLEHSTLPYLPSHALVSKKFFGLIIVNSTLTGLFDEVPSSNNLIHMFVLENVRIQRAIQWSMFQKLTKLRIMQLIKIVIKRLGKDFISNINPGLAEIFLSQTKTTSLSDNVFENMKELHQLAIIRSEIRTLKRSMFPKPARIATLDFQ
ncbi:uncharacterized protein NPIL_414681 [Nephila pilipes]|uniref:Uncharacterized protein n=1 Tax=Nephila pilipes TaxID=299642 RepID=A0A8X6TQT4_NEPPI|nr:uncharacterized protein NPIL_414681 [Nephila pilipes]